MSRLMSVALTEEQVRARTKTVTRRLGWVFLKPGDRLTLCLKVMGRKKGEPLVRIAEVEVVSVSRVLLDSITHTDVEREGFPGASPEAFVDFFCVHMKCAADTRVTRIEWRYLDRGPVILRCPLYGSDDCDALFQKLDGNAVDEAILHHLQGWPHYRSRAESTWLLAKVEEVER